MATLAGVSEPSVFLWPNPGPLECGILYSGAGGNSKFSLHVSECVGGLLHPLITDNHSLITKTLLLLRLPDCSSDVQVHVLYLILQHLKKLLVYARSKKKQTYPFLRWGGAQESVSCP